MRSFRNVIAAAVGGFALLCTAASAQAQRAEPADTHPTRVASVTTGSIAGTVRDEAGVPVPGALVSAVGTTTAFAFSDRAGRFQLLTLSPGSYLVRAHSVGFLASRGEIVQVQPSASASSSIQLRRAAAAGRTTTGAQTSSEPTVLTAAIGGVLEPQPESAGTSATPDAGVSSPDDEDHGEVAWRLRHARRGILKDLTDPVQALAGNDTPPALERGAPSAMRVANLFAGMSLSGQVNLLATGSFETPQQLFTGDTFSHNVTFISLATPAGERGEWTMRGAVTSGDLSSWFVAAAYSTRPDTTTTNRYALGVTYSTQRYDGGNPAALRDVRDGSRNVGAVYASDSVSLTPTVSLSYGGKYARYDYIPGHGLFSPHVEVTLVPAARVRVRARAASESVAPGAEEFLPPDTGLWLPPQRTFSPLVDAHEFTTERTTNVTLEAEREVASTTVSVRVFRQHVAHQLATIFGIVPPNAANATLGHFYVGESGNVDATGWAAAVSAEFTPRVHGSVEFASARADWTPGADAAYLLLVAPGAVRPALDRVEQVSTSLETNVPETATRVLIVCRITTSPADAPDAPAYDPRFDVQLHQSLPFMNFTSAKWEMLLAVRNFFHEASPDSSVYDEMLVVHPPKRLVGGLTVRF